MLHANRAFFVDSGEGQANWFFGTLMTLKADSEDTHNTFALQEHVCPPGLRLPLHIHHNQDEALYMLEGEITVICGDQTWRAMPGCFVFLPQGVAHTYYVEGEALARMLVITSPGSPFGFEYFVEEMGDPAPASTHPPTEPADEQKLQILAEKYAIEIVLPA